jgi:hypothetical protein
MTVKHERWTMKQALAVTLVALYLFSGAVAKAQDQWKLIWYNHYQPNTLFEVLSTDLSVGDITNNLFQTWCKPFDPSGFQILEKVEIAGDEHWKVPPQFLSDRGLPMLNERWFQIMDDERWYVFKVRPR